MKILIVTQFYYPERFSTSDIAEGLLKEGHDVTVITGRPNYGYGHVLKEYKHVKYEEINGVKVHRVHLLARKKSHLSVCFNYLSFYFSAKRFVRHFKEEFDIVLSISLSPVISIAPAIKYARKHHVKSVLYCEDLWPESTVIAGAVRKGSLLYKILYKWSVAIYRNIDEIIISSPSFKDYFENELKITDKGFKYINQPIIESKNKTIDPIIFSHKHNLVYAGNIAKLQLVDKLVNSMSLIQSEDTKLYLLGMGQLLDEINKLIKAKHLEDKVEYVGAFPIEEAERYFINADALVVSLSSIGPIGKTIPNKAIQYMKYSRPILGVISGDGKELLKNAKGTIFAEENEIDIASKIDLICELSSSQKDELGKNNKDYFDNHLNSEKIAHELSLELIKSRN